MESALLQAKADGLAAVIDNALDAAVVQTHGFDGFDVVSTRSKAGTIELAVVEPLIAPYRLHPVRKKGTVHLDTPATFGEYVRAHREKGTAVYAWRDGLELVALVNGHEPGDEPGDADRPCAGWGDHRAVLKLKTTRAWDAWLNHDGGFMSQAEFAEFLEERTGELVSPDAATMLDIARSIEVKSDGAYRSAMRDGSGQINFSYDETIEAKAGQAGQLVIPERIELALEPFAGAGTYRVKARFRYRMRSGNLSLGYVLDRPDAVIDTAFTDVVTQVRYGMAAQAFAELNDSTTVVALNELNDLEAQALTVFLGRPS